MKKTLRKMEYKTNELSDEYLTQEELWERYGEEIKKLQQDRLNPAVERLIKRLEENGED